MHPNVFNIYLQVFLALVFENAKATQRFATVKLFMSTSRPINFINVRREFGVGNSGAAPAPVSKYDTAFALILWLNLVKSSNKNSYIQYAAPARNRCGSLRLRSNALVKITNKVC
jgi:hypothetical protein